MPYVSLMRPSVANEADYEAHDDRLRYWRIRACDACIRSLPRLYGKAIEARYLRDGWESEIADQAEIRLVQMLARRGVVL